jgi:hypothetical protein
LTIADGNGYDLKNNGTLTVNGTMNDAGTIVFSGTIQIAAGSHFKYSGADQSVKAGTYDWLELSGVNSTKTFAAGTTVVAHEIILSDSGMTITGADVATTTVQVATPGENGTVARVFHTNVGTGNNITIENMTIKGGDISGLSGDAANGGTIFHESGTLTINHAVIGYSKAVNGGAIYSHSILNITDSTVSSGYATNNGGGLYNSYSTMTISTTTIDNNLADRSGGGISSYRATETTLDSSTVSNNQGYRYAGILSYDSDLVLLNSTVSGNNSSTIIGGVGSFKGKISILNSTISNNTAGTVFGSVFNNYSQLYLVNSIVINNPLSGGGTDNDIKTSTNGGTSYAFYSWYDGSKISGNLNTNAGAPNLTSLSDGTLAALAANDGSTQTMAVTAGNIIGAGSFVYYNSIDGYYFADQSGSNYHHLNYELFTPSNPAADIINTDQRDKIRGGATPDPYIPTMGAYEVNIDTTMIDELPDGDEYSTDEFSDLLKVHQATQDEFDSALLEFIA